MFSYEDYRKIIEIIKSTGLQACLLYTSDAADE